MNMKEIYKCGNKKSLLKFLSEGFCGERGIRTPGTSRYGSFQDYCNRPLYHLSKTAGGKGFEVVPPGIEPGTQGFSVLCSTN